MRESDQPEQVASANERSLSTLSRAITLCEGNFALILVRCNYGTLQQQMRQQLQELCNQKLLEIVLPQSVNTLFTSILKAIAPLEAIKTGTEEKKETVLQNEERLATNKELEEDTNKHSSIQQALCTTSSEEAASPTLTTLNTQHSPYQGLMVLGLESVTAIDFVLISTNQVRDEFRKSLTFPLVLWVTDEVLQKLTRFAPDFKSWAAASIKFELSVSKLLALWRQMASDLFAKLLDSDIGQFISLENLDLALGCRRRQELEFAQKDLRTKGVSLESALIASWEFILGRDAYTKDKIDCALAHYQQSMEVGTGDWRFGTRDKGVGTGNNSSQSPITGVLLFHIGLCYCRQAELQPAESYKHYLQARNNFQQAVEVFKNQGRLDLAAHAIIQLGEVLRHLKAWTDLQVLAKSTLIQPYICNNPIQLSQTYGFLAEVASEQNDWVAACDLAHTALSTLAESSEPQPQLLGWYLLILALSQRRLGLVEAAIERLKLAKEETEPQAGKFKHQVSPQLYIDILEELRSLHFQQGHFLQAFQFKQEQRSIKQQYRFCTFVGAASLQPHPQLETRNHVSSNLGIASLTHHFDNTSLQTNNKHGAGISTGISTEIAASGRQKDVNRLIERLSRNDRKLTVIHGASGVGKSSLINAGLIPALKGSILGARIALPVVLSTYTDWVGELGKRLAQELESLNLPTCKPISLPTIIEQLRQNADCNLLTVLIFDQFDEFFCIFSTPTNRQLFYDFFRDCLNLPFVKVILCLREDYLHYLLECDRFCHLDAINNNILDRDMRYYLQDLSPKEATSVIYSLTERSQFYLEPALIEAFVKDLARERGAIRLIELQVMGAQLQAEYINTLEQYQHLGPNPMSELVKRSLQDVITDCGTGNEDAVWSVLFSLTNKGGTRTLRTKPELAADFLINSSWLMLQNHEPATLELILNILVGSGLVLRVPEEPENRYQLVHDYLVEPIREAYEWRVQLNVAAEIATREQELNRVRKQKLQAVSVGTLMTVLAVAAGGFAWRAEAEKSRAFIAETNAQLSAMSASSEALFVSHKHFDALIESVRAARLMNRSTGVEPEVRAMVVTALEQSVYGEKERNRLEGHTDVVWHLSFSPDGQTIASSSRDKTVRLWRPDGTNLAILKGHEDSVTSISFSPNSQTIASASWDKTVKLWRRDGQLLRTLRGHEGQVLSVSFSPDGTHLASASQDGTIKIWTVEGNLIKTFIGHQGGVTWVSFSPDGQVIASTGEDKTVKLWDYNGNLLNTLNGHNGKVNYVSFSPDGQTIASASDDKTVKLWDRTGKLTKTLQGHQNWVFGVTFNANGEIASASEDNTVKIWSRTGTLIKTLEGHSDGVTSVGFSPDGETIVSASYDKTVKVWQLNHTSRTTLQGHSDDVTDISFSPDGQAIASASKDNTVKLWKHAVPEGAETTLHKSGNRAESTFNTSNFTLQSTLKGHTDRVNSVSFSPDGQIASASKDKTIKLWSRTGALMKTLLGHSDFVLAVKFSPNGQLIASASRDKTIKLWSNTGTLIRTLSGHSDRVNAVTFSPDGLLLASASDDKTVKIWNLTGTLLKTLKGHTNWVLDVSFSADGLLLASASYDNTVKLWSPTGKGNKLEIHPYKTLKGPTDSVAHVRFSPDGQMLATTSWDNRVQLWRLDDTLIKNLEGHSSRVTNINFSPDGKTLASSSNDGSVILWNLNLDDLLGRSCYWLHDYLQTNPRVKQSDRHLCEK